MKNIYQGRKILVTGASSGIGLEFARILSNYHCTLIIVSSRRPVLREVRNNLSNAGPAKIYSYAADLSNLAAVEKLYNHLRENSLIPDILINNAGRVSYGYFHKLDWPEEHRQVVVNCLTPIYLIHKILPQMIANNFGKILNVGSVAGTMASPFFSTYASSKAFLNTFSQALSGELRGTNVSCVCLLPGKTKSERFYNLPHLKERVGEMAGFAPPRSVAEYGLKLLEQGKDYGVYGWDNKLKQFIKRFVPRPLLNKALRKHSYSQSLEDQQAHQPTHRPMPTESKLSRNFHRFKAVSRTVYNLIKYKITKKPIPICVTFQITKYCNLRCVYCYADADSLRLRDVPDFTYEEYTRLIDEIVELGCRWVRFLGGEPLLRKDIGQMIDYAHHKGMLTEMNTNGYFMKQKAQEIRNLDSLVVSIDGTRETNDKCRGQGCYDKCIEAIEIAKDLGMPVRLHGCLSRYHTQKDIDHLAELAVKYGTSFNFSAPSPVYFEDDQRMHDHPSQEQVAMLHQRCAELKKMGYPLINTRAAAEYVKKWPKPGSDVLTKEDIKKMNIPKSSYVPCLGGKLYCTIDVDGMVYACAGYWRNGINAKKVGFQKAWEHIHNLECISCNYLANIELNLLYHLNPRTIFEVASYILGRTSKIGRKIRAEK